MLRRSLWMMNGESLTQSNTYLGIELLWQQKSGDLVRCYRCPNRLTNRLCLSGALVTQIKCISNGLYLQWNSHIPFGKSFHPPYPPTPDFRWNGTSLLPGLAFLSYVCISKIWQDQACTCRFAWNIWDSAVWKLCNLDFSDWGTNDNVVIRGW